MSRSVVSPRGHLVLQVPVPVLEDIVRERTAYYDRRFLCEDPGFVHAHITALAPFVPEPDDRDLAAVARIVASTVAFEAVLRKPSVFPNGIIHLRPEPDDGFRDLTARLSAAFPACTPYDGRFGDLDDLVPHLTLDAVSADVDVASVRRRLADRIPVRILAERLDLVRYESGACRRVASWPFGPGAAPSVD